MSLYNAITGYDPACVYIMPTLGKTWDEYPRFREGGVKYEINR